MTITDLCFKYKSDKGVTPINDRSWMHSYSLFYDKIFESRRNEKLNILDIGAWGENEGGSSLMWKEFFPNAQIFALDLNPRVNELGSKGIAAKDINLDDEAAFLSFIELNNIRYDIVIEDASHQPKQQIRTLLNLRPFLNNDFQYVIEDVCDNHTILDAIKSGVKLPYLSDFEWLYLRGSLQKMQIVETNQVSKLIYIQ